jgi:hypothetical protein
MFLFLILFIFLSQAQAQECLIPSQNQNLNFNDISPQKSYCPNSIKFNPSTLFLPPRYIPFVNTSSLNNIKNQIYTPTKPKIDETVITIKNAEVCAPEGAAATFLVKTDVYANIAEIEFINENGRKIWIPKPNNFHLPAVFNIESLFTIRMNRDFLDIEKKVNCDSIGNIEFATLSNSIVRPQFIKKENCCDLDKKIIPNVGSLEQLIIPLFKETFQELQFELEESAFLILGNALRQAGLCVQMESLDFLFGPLPPSTIKKIDLESDFEYNWQQCFPSTSTFEICSLREDGNNACLILKEAAMKNVRIIESIASADSLIHIKGFVAIGFLYENEGGYLAYKNVPFFTIVNRLSGAIDVGLSYEASKTLSILNFPYEGSENDFFIQTSKLLDIDLTKAIADWTLQKLIEMKIIIVVETQ